MIDAAPPPAIEAPAPIVRQLPAGMPPCAVPKTPRITVGPRSDEIAYDFSRTQADLTSLQGGGPSPFPPGAIATTEGLREDHPKIEMNVQWGYMEYPAQKIACLWYDSIDVNIQLSPRIFIAREIPIGVCKDTVLAHERHHVDIDRDVMNQYSRSIGVALQKLVDNTGAAGPYDIEDVRPAGKRLMAQASAVLEEEQGRLRADLMARQSAFDSLTEYERISNICRDTLHR